MFRRAGQMALALALAGCTEQVVLKDLPSTSDAAVGSRDAWPGSDANCGPLKNTVRMTYEPQPAELLILLDRSTAMQAYYGSIPRETAAQNALIGAVWQYQARIKFGFEEFPSDPLEYQCPQGTCCAGPVVDPSLNNYSGMSYNIQCSDAHGSGCPATSSDSPSHAALAQVREYYKAKDKQSPPTNDRYVLLVTSSEPSCASESHDVCSQARTAASDLGNVAGVRIVVLSMGYQPDPNLCLSQISQKGSTQPLPANTKPLYTVYNSYDLSAALTEFFSAVAQASCTLISRDAPPTLNQAQLSVSVGGRSVQPIDGSGNGWAFGDPAGTSITFSGSACEDWVNNSQYSKPYVLYSEGPNNCPSWP